MATLGRIRGYDVWLRTGDDEVKVKVSDILRIDVTIGVRYIHSVHSIETTLLKESISISCQNFIQNNQDFLRSFMFDPRCSTSFSPASIDLYRLSEEIVDMSINIIEFGCDSEYVDSKCQELPLKFDITVEILPPGETTMIPPSKGAIDSLNTFTPSSSLREGTQNCSICMEDLCFREKLLSMPCNHVFHHLCIVEWLKISRTCPLCRYPIPHL
ncbi:E3 ubiquitin-protein ligase ATL15-like [Vigna unguiculata]|uniref:E3 ubiquitin-protein ligase ATL15-like n=1 Tax=Vigna unguiculata TaxID=3917 RepID=UPI0010162FF3|nr:E3 ubiquitin-protein ligase ATL15-like [Vigna unguiculata]